MNYLQKRDAAAGNYVPYLLFDGANGVGTLAVAEILKRVPKEVLDIKIFIDGSAGGILNYKVNSF